VNFNKDKVVVVSEATLGEMGSDSVFFTHLATARVQAIQARHPHRLSMDTCRVRLIVAQLNPRWYCTHITIIIIMALRLCIAGRKGGMHVCEVTTLQVVETERL
jgi:hypothetical protein